MIPPSYDRSTAPVRVVRFIDTDDGTGTAFRRDDSWGVNVYITRPKPVRVLGPPPKRKASRIPHNHKGRPF